MEYDCYKKCRTCLSENPVMYALFENYENNISLADILYSLLKVQLSIYDNLPQKICQECATLLIQFYNFSIILEESNKKLQNYVNNNLKCTEIVPKLEEGSVKVPLNETLITDVHENANDELEGSLKYESDDAKTILLNVEKTEDWNNCEEIIICPTNSAINHNSDVETPKCNICNRKFKTFILLEKHSKCHIQSKKYICEVCGYISLKKSYLVDHMTMHTNHRPYSCNYCGKTFRQRSAFSRHKKIHTNPMKIVCELCGKKFANRDTLKTHIHLLHIKTKNFKCIICNQSFSLKGTLDKHLERHQHKEGATKNFTCNECNMRYFDKSSLNRHHLIKHSGEDVKVKCEYCNKNYTAKTNLYKHIKMHHREKDVQSAI